MIFNRANGSTWEPPSAPSMTPPAQTTEQGIVAGRPTLILPNLYLHGNSISATTDNHAQNLNIRYFINVGNQQQQPYPPPIATPTKPPTPRWEVSVPLLHRCYGNDDNTTPVYDNRKLLLNTFPRVCDLIEQALDEILFEFPDKKDRPCILVCGGDTGAALVAAYLMRRVQRLGFTFEECLGMVQTKTGFEMGEDVVGQLRVWWAKGCRVSAEEGDGEMGRGVGSRKFCF